ncbi:putative LRR containing protein [Trachipleistophora hominis]|uniref:Putative LRR containing protein n=1 Tax=Trachipleistophora hominis TaxID=72359 RepID=L7JVX6_TRAHO|nr:putative LRR containing protein [Trachipleistophora hominis]
MEELHPMRCTVEGIYVFTRDPSDSLLNFDLKDAQLDGELVIPNNIQKVRLVNVSEMQKFFITVNELCKTLLIENSTGIVICNSPMNLEKIVVSQSSLSALELRFSTSTEAMFDLNYEFEGGQNEQICVHIKNLCSLSFKHGCSNNIATIPKLMSDKTCDTSTLHLSESSYFAKDTKNAYDVDTANLNLITLLKGHLMIDITSSKRLNRKRLVQISITNSQHISQRRMD